MVLEFRGEQPGPEGLACSKCLGIPAWSLPKFWALSLLCCLCSIPYANAEFAWPLTLAFVSRHCPLDFTDLSFRIWPSTLSWEVSCTLVPVLSKINTVSSGCLLPGPSAVVVLQNPSALSYFLLRVCIWISSRYLDFRCPKWISWSPSFLFSKTIHLLLSCVSVSVGISVYPDSQQNT